MVRSARLGDNCCKGRSSHCIAKLKLSLFISLLLKDADNDKNDVDDDADAQSTKSHPLIVGAPSQFHEITKGGKPKSLELAFDLLKWNYGL